MCCIWLISANLNLNQGKMLTSHAHVLIFENSTSEILDSARSEAKIPSLLSILQLLFSPWDLALLHSMPKSCLPRAINSGYNDNIFSALPSPYEEALQRSNKWLRFPAGMIQIIYRGKIVSGCCNLQVPAKKLVFVLNIGMEILDQHHKCDLSRSCVCIHEEFSEISRSSWDVFMYRIVSGIVGKEHPK